MNGAQQDDCCDNLIEGGTTRVIKFTEHKITYEEDEDSKDKYG